MSEDYYTWAEFKEEVLKLLPLDRKRIGETTATGDTASDFLNSLMVQAVIQLQRVIPSFRTNHETIYYPEDMVREGMACRISKPPQSAFRDLSLFRINEDETVDRHQGVPYSWANRFDLVNGAVPSNDSDAHYSIEPSGATLYVYPMPENECWLVSLFWNGQKVDFDDEEKVPFSQAAALAVSYFVKANTSMEIEDGVSAAEKYLKLFGDEKTRLYIDRKSTRLNSSHRL